MITCRLCGEVREMAAGICHDKIGSFFNLRLTLKAPVCENCKDNLLEDMFSTGTEIVWGK